MKRFGGADSMMSDVACGLTGVINEGSFDSKVSGRAVS